VPNLPESRSEYGRQAFSSIRLPFQDRQVVAGPEVGDLRPKYVTIPADDRPRERRRPPSGWNSRKETDALPLSARRSRQGEFSADFRGILNRRATLVTLPDEIGG
jgi:hypothetical protein